VKESTNRPDAYLYSVIRAVPNPRRGECVNLGVVVIAPDGHYSDARFGSLARVRKLDSNADIDSIRLFLSGILSVLPMHGNQGYLAAGDPAIDASTLSMWSRDFGGAVRVSEPRSALASDPGQLLDQLFRDYVASPSSEPVAMRAVPEQTPSRAQVLTAFDRSVARWDDPDVRPRSGATVRGRRAHHHVDRILETQSSTLIAVIEAISFGSRDLTEVYGRRATICLAAEDLQESAVGRPVAAFALHTTAPQDRIEALQESAELFRTRGVTPVLFTDLEPIRRIAGNGLQLQ